MSDNGTTTTQPEANLPPPLSRADYNKAVDELARGIYHSMSKAGFNRDTIEALALGRQKNSPFDNLPTKVKICLIKLAMSMMPIQPTEDKKEEKETTAAPAEQGK